MVLGKARKKLKDYQTLRKYAAKLAAARKVYTQTTEAYSDTDRKSRALTAGECVLKTLEAVGQLNLEHKLIPGTLEYMIDQQKVQDDTGRKGFRYQVAYQVSADEPRFTQEEIRAEIEDLAKRLKIENEYLFGKQEEEEEKEPSTSEE